MTLVVWGHFMAGPCVESWRQIIYYRPGRCWDHVSALRKLYISRRRKEKDGQSKNAANNRLMEIERLALNGCSMNWATSFLSLAVALLCFVISLSPFSQRPVPLSYLHSQRCDMRETASILRTNWHPSSGTTTVHSLRPTSFNLRLVPCHQ